MRDSGRNGVFGENQISVKTRRQKELAERRLKISDVLGRIGRKGVAVVVVVEHLFQ